MPTNAAQAKAFMSPASLSFPNGNGSGTQVASQQLTPPGSEKGKEVEMKAGGSIAEQGAAWSGVSGIVPTLQYV